MPLPSGEKFEVEFVAGTWTDVTADYDANQGKSITFGRNSTQSQPSASSIQFRLRNPKGKYTPGLAVLSDGTAAPYYPNVKRRVRVRYSTSAGVRGIWRVRSWKPVLDNGVSGYCVVNADDRLYQLGKVTMAADISGEVLADNPIAYWQLNEAAGSKASGNSSGVTTAGLYVSGSGAALTYGNDGPGVEQGLAVTFNQGQYLGSIINFQRPYTSFTLECWVKYTTVNQSIESIAEIVDNNGNRHLIATGTAGPASGIQLIELTPGSSVGTTATSAYNDGQWHHVAVGTDTSRNPFVYVDGVSVGGGLALPAFGSILGVRLSQDVGNPSFLGSVAHVAVYDYALSSTRILAHYLVAQQSAETTDAKIRRWLTYAGLASGEMSLDASTLTTGTYAQDGQDVVSASQDMATTEGNGSVVYVANDIVQFRTRTFRAKNSTPTLTLDAVHDLDRSVYEPSVDDQNLVNKITVSRNTASGTQSTQVAANAASIAAEELTSLGVTSYAATDRDALSLAQSIVAAGSTSGFRMNRVAVDLVNAKNNLYSAVWATTIGSRIRVTNLPAGAAPASQVDLFVEGWTETSNATSFQVVFDTSPADAPPTMLANDTTYGRARELPDCALNATITAAASSLVIKTPTAPHFTTKAGSYPLYIQVDAEVIKLNAAPGGSTSPQTFSSISRAQQGTTAAAHASNAPVTIWPPVGAAR